ncbi:MAG: hypothetical protein AAF449_01720, partial [Myxococcota bacterium]
MTICAVIIEARSDAKNTAALAVSATLTGRPSGGTANAISSCPCSSALAIRQKQQEGEKIVLGLATGSTPIRVYNELVRMHREEGLSFRNVITFNLDEYYPMNPDSPQSYVYFMNEYLFNHIDILP